MVHWQPSSSVQRDFYYDWFLHKKLLVKIYHAGQYLTLFNEKKVPDSEVPHIEVLLDGTTENGIFFYTNTNVRVYSPAKNNPSLIMSIWKSGEQPKSRTPDILINLAKTQLDDAAKTLVNMKSLFRAAKNRVKKARAYPTVFATREAYEKACKNLGVPSLSDELCYSHRIQYGEFKFPDLSGDQCLTLKLARRRLRGIKAERSRGGIIRPLQFSRPAGQQWEACKICGDMPRLLPLMVCEKCWPKE